MESKNIKKVIELARKTGVIRPKDLDKYNINRKYLYILHQKGLLERIGRGLYSSPDYVVTEHRTMVEVCKKVPNAVICLLSALNFHDLTTQLPHQIWIAINRKASFPRKSEHPVKVVCFSGKALTEGVEEHEIEGVKIRIYNPAKTVADCFKYRNKIGIDIAIEAMKSCLQSRKAKPAEIMHYARICRISSVIKPYMEAVL